jgi:mono/diheme cytochrome c family protein
VRRSLRRLLHQFRVNDRPHVFPLLVAVRPVTAFAPGVYYAEMWRWMLIAVLAVDAIAQKAVEPPPDPIIGRKIFESQCALCHGQTGGGGRGPSLNRPQLNPAPDDEALRRVISDGIQIRRRRARSQRFSDGTVFRIYDLRCRDSIHC